MRLDSFQRSRSPMRRKVTHGECPVILHVTVKPRKLVARRSTRQTHCVPITKNLEDLSIEELLDLPLRDFLERVNDDGHPSVLRSNYGESGTAVCVFARGLAGDRLMELIEAAFSETAARN